jgi:hypothetical protein
MSKDLKTPNPEQPGRIFEAELHDGVKTDDDPPLPPDERRRGVVRLCCNFMRNLAFHRAGRQNEVREYLLNRNHPQGEFWIQGHGNCLDTCVLDWCKMFADYDGEHHWHRVVDDDDRARFKRDLFTAVGKGAEFNQTFKKVKHYRDKFVAHLDEERVMLLPDLEVARQATVFLFERLAQMIASPKEWQDLPASTEELAFLYRRASEQAESVYHEAVRAAQRL